MWPKRVEARIAVIAPHSRDIDGVLAHLDDPVEGLGAVLVIFELDEAVLVTMRVARKKNSNLNEFRFSMRR